MERSRLSGRAAGSTCGWQGPEYLSDEELLGRAIAGEDELQRTVRELEQNVSELKLRASELERERERDEARESASASRRPYQELERAYQKEVAAHKETNELREVQNRRQASVDGWRENTSAVILV